MFLTFDGGDCCGKSTQIRLLADWLIERGVEIVLCRDPGSTELGDEIRKILLHSQELEMSATSEMLLFMTARSQLVEEVIRPALKAGKTVLSDRFLLSNIVYQGYAGGLSIPDLRAVGHIATQGIEPDLGFVLDIPYEIARERLSRRGTPDRMEKKGSEYHRRVREGFVEFAQKKPEQYVLIDATESIDCVQQKIRDRVASFYRN